MPVAGDVRRQGCRRPSATGTYSSVPRRWVSGRQGRKTRRLAVKTWRLSRLKPFLPAAEFVDDAVCAAANALGVHGLFVVVLLVAQHLEFPFEFEATVVQIVTYVLRVDSVQDLAGLFGVSSLAWTGHLVHVAGAGTADQCVTRRAHGDRSGPPARRRCW